MQRFAKLRTWMGRLAIAALAFGTTLGAAARPADAQAMSFIRVLKQASDSNYLWQPGLTGTQPDMLLGRPIFEIPDLGDVATTNAIPIALADWRNFYAILDRRQVSVIPDTVTRPGFVGCLNWRWPPFAGTRYQPSS